MSELIPFNFHGDPIECIKEGDGLWVAIKPICQNVGVSHQGQMAKLSTKDWATIKMILTVGADGKERAVTCIDLDSLPMWLATIEPSRVDKRIRGKLKDYQRECARVLRDHFFGFGPKPESSSAELAETRALLSQATALLAQTAALVTQAVAHPDAIQRAVDAAFERRTGVLGRAGAKRLLSQIRQHTDLATRNAKHTSREWKSVRARRESALRDVVGWHGRWERCPMEIGPLENQLSNLGKPLGPVSGGLQLNLAPRVGHA
jgi:hypothetical protein